MTHSSIRKLWVGSLLIGWGWLSAAAGDVPASVVKGFVPAPVERKIVREPRYSGTPRYCLLALGPKAETRVWLALDGDVLYVDRNGNGDLTEAGKRVEGVKGVFRIGELVERGGDRHTDVTVLVDQKIPQIDGTDKVIPYEVSLRVRGKYRIFGEPIFSEQAAAAPVLRMNAPMQMDLLRPNAAPPGALIDPAFFIRSHGIGPNSTALVDHETIPRELHPLAELEFSTPDGPHKMEIPLRIRCCGSTFMGTVKIPATASDKVKLRVTYPDWKDAEILPSEAEIPLLRLPSQ